MTLSSDTAVPVRRFPRALAYPFWVVVLVCGIFGGIKLGGSQIASRVVLASQNDTPVENWTLFLLGIGVVMFFYVDHLYAHRSFRVPLAPMFVAVAALAALLLFGAWGLGGIAVACVLTYVAYYLRWRLRTQRSQVSGK